MLKASTKRYADDRYVVYVSTHQDGASVAVSNETNAVKLVLALREYARNPKPSKMHWVSNRLRNLSPEGRTLILELLDSYIGGGHDLG